MALRELLPVRAEDVREVPVGGERRSEGLEDPDLLGRVRDVVVGPEDVRDPVEPVLDRRSEVVGGPSVGPDEHEVLELVVRILDPAADQVVPAGDAVVGHPHPDCALVLVRLFLGEQALRLLLAALHPVELEGDLAVPVEAEPAVCLLDLLGRLGNLSPRVRVLDPEQELAALAPSVEPVEQRRVGPADVQEAGRAGREADSN